jgi:hypothetical protein
MWMDRELLVLRPRAVLLITGGYILATLLAIGVVDIAGIGAWIPAQERGAPLWWVLFGEGAPTEWVQAVVLATLVLYAGAAAAVYVDRERDLSAMLALFGVGAVALLLEDTGNVGQWFAHWANVLNAPGGSENAHLYRLPIFALAAAVPTYALLRYRSALRRHPRARRWVWAGFGAYAFLAVTGELLEALFPVYRVVGAFVLGTVLRGTLDPPGDTPSVMWADVEIVFMDYIYEESLELVAMTLLLVGVLTLLRSGLATRALGTGVGERAPADGAVPDDPRRE